MSLDRIEHARHLLAEAGELLTTDPAQLYWLARQVGPLLSVVADLQDQLAAALEPRSTVEDIKPVPADVGGWTHRGGNWIEVPTKPCGCGVLLGEVCDCGSFATQAEAAFASPLQIGRTR